MYLFLLGSVSMDFSLWLEMYLCALLTIWFAIDMYKSIKNSEPPEDNPL